MCVTSSILLNHLIKILGKHQSSCTKSYEHMACDGTKRVQKKKKIETLKQHFQELAMAPRITSGKEGESKAWLSTGPAKSPA